VPSAEIVTVGIPFCAFKLLTGLLLLESVAPVGYALLVLGAIDLVLNTVNLVALVVAQRRVSAVCLAELAFRKSDLGLAVDVFVSFGLVALVIGAGLLPHAPAWALPLWNLAVVLNVLGAGVGRLLAAVVRSQSSSAA
jgi:hypothetical protein